MTTENEIVTTKRIDIPAGRIWDLLRERFSLPAEMPATFRLVDVAREPVHVSLSADGQVTHGGGEFLTVDWQV